jgi:hypothetical protein
MSTRISRQIYVQQILDLYRRAPGTTGHVRKSDRRLAGELHYSGITLDVIRSAIFLAVARRSFRPASAPPLAPIASLHYFRPVIDELIADPPDPGYLSYVQHMLATVAPNFVATGEHRLP